MMQEQWASPKMVPKCGCKTICLMPFGCLRQALRKELDALKAQAAEIEKQLSQ